MTDEILKVIETIDKKERLLVEIVVWLKVKGYYDDCMEDIGWTISKSKVIIK